MKYTILYNSLSDNKNGYERAKGIEKRLSNVEKIKYIDLFQIEDVLAFVKNLPADEIPVICGGDGSINHFVTDLDDEYLEREILYFPCGSGNDFARDVLGNDKREIIRLNDYIEDLPKVVVKDKKYRYINNVGYGVDGYVCYEADELRKNTNKSINYPLIAVKGIFFKFKPKNATVVIDGQSYTFKKVWLASTFNGRYYGGGMPIAPKQDRLDPTKEQTFVALHGCGKLKALMIFGGVFDQKHVKYTKNVTFITGKDVEVSFDKPSPIQLDGEVIEDVLSYKIKI